MGYSKIELEIINISLGLTIKFARLEENLSQLELGNLCDADNTAVGRIERAEHVSSWENIYKVSQTLGLNFCSLFLLPSEKALLQILNDCLQLETKLTDQKRAYYTNMESRIRDLYKQRKDSSGSRYLPEES